MPSHRDESLLCPVDPHCVYNPYISNPTTGHNIMVRLPKQPSFCMTTSLMFMGSDSRISDMLRRSCKVLSLSEQVENPHCISIGIKEAGSGKDHRPVQTEPVHQSQVLPGSVGRANWQMVFEQ